MPQKINSQQNVTNVNNQKQETLFKVEEKINKIKTKE